MKVYSLIIIMKICICCIWKYTAVDIMPGLKRNMFNFDKGLTLNMWECFHTHLVDFMWLLINFTNH